MYMLIFNSYLFAGKDLFMIIFFNICNAIYQEIFDGDPNNKGS